VTVLFLVLAAVCFAVSATRKAGVVPWHDIGMILLTVAFIFWIAAPGVDLD
jgi:hypothetical protein